MKNKNYNLQKYQSQPGFGYIPGLLRICVLLLLSSLWSSSAIAQNVEVSTGGPVTNYTTLGAAFTAINAGTHTGAILIEIASNTTETGPCILNSSGAGPATYSSILIRPRVDAVTISGATVTGRGLIELNGADNITINGDNPNTGGVNRNLTITNTAANTVTYTSVIRVATSTLITSANNLTIRNCILNGSATGRNISTATSTTGTENTTYAILAAGGASTVSATTAPGAITSVSSTIASGQTLLNFTVINNEINTCARAISVNGAAITVCPILTITDNVIGNPVAAATNQVYAIGITAQGCAAGSVIARNTIRVENFVGSSVTHGITLGSVSSNGTGVVVELNSIERAISNNTGGWGVRGIDLVAGNANIVRNNFVRNVNNGSTSSFSTGFGAFGIRIAAGTGHSVVYNTVHLSGVNPGAGSGIVAALGITGTGLTGLDVRNNILSNVVTGSGASSAHVALYLPTAGTSTMNLLLNNNAYFTGSTAGLHGILQVGTTYSAANLYTAANFNASAITPSTNSRAYTSLLSTSGTNDNASIATSSPAPFVSATDLHISVGSTIVNNVGTPIAGVTTDFDGDTRNATTPDIGADEYTPLVCAAAAGGTISPASATRCANQTYTMSTTGSEVGSGVSYQWEISSTGGGIGFNDVTGGIGATTTSYTTPALLPGVYYYRLRVTCSFGPVTGYSNELVLTVNANPSVSVDVSAANYCNPGGTAITINASGATSYSWLPVAGLNVATGSTVVATPASSTNYTVTGTDANGCTATATSVITVLAGMSISSVTATPATVCSGANSQLQVTAAAAGANTAAGTIYTATTGEFESIPSPVSVTTPTSGTADDGFEPVNTTGSFVFNYNGTNYDNFVISTNGYVVMGATAPALNGIVTSLTSTVLNGFNAVIGYGRDGNINVTNGGSINHGLDASGTKYVFEYFNFATATGGAESATQYGSFQIILWGNASTTPGKIELIYGTSVGTPATAACIGLRDASGTTAFKNGLTGSSTVASTTATFPVDQTMYTFERQTYTYAWTPSSFIAGQESLSNPLATAVTSTTAYAVTATAANGCSASGNVTVTVEPLACTSATAGPINCANTNFTVTANHTGGGAPFDYSWDDGVGGVYPNSSNITANLPAGTYTFICTVTDDCGSSCTSSISVTVNANPVTTVTPNTGLICNPGGSPVALAAAGASTYAWSPSAGLSATTGDNVTANPSGTRTYTVTGTDANGCTSTASATITVAGAITATATATPATICSGSNSQLAVAVSPAPGGGAIKITEVTTFRTGTGATSPYPAFATGADLVEISNISSSPVDISGWTLEDFANNATTAAHPGFAFPSGTILPAGSVAVVCLGTGTDDIVNRYFNTGGTNDFWLSTGVYGIVVKNGSTVIDAVGRGNPYNWNAATGVTPADWSGTISTSSAAGIVRTAALDNNLGSDWVLSTITQATIGTFNTGYIPPVTIASYAWSPSAFIAGQEALQNPLATALTATTPYSVLVTTTDGCTSSSSATVTVNDPPSANAGGGASLCNLTASFTLSGATASNFSSLVWTTSGDGGFDNATVLNPTYTPGPNDLLNGTVILTLTANGNAPCPSASSNVTLTYFNAIEYYTDSDGDTYGGTSAGFFCSNPGAGFSLVSGDCNDGNAAVNPAATEICNGIDDNCNGLTDDGIPALANPGSITGTAAACLPGIAGTASFSVAPVAGATTYTWTVPAGFTITSGQGTTSINVSYTATAIQNGISGSLCVTASNACVSSPASCVNIDYQIAAPVTPPSISGQGKVCPGDNVTYSIATVARATSYTWTVPTGVTITGGQGTNVITATVNAGFIGGSVSVVANNVCGSSPARSRSLTQNLPSTPTAIQGAKEGLCNIIGNVFFIPVVANATSYNWGASGASISSGNGTTSITADVALLIGSGTITVQAVNGCGTSLTRTLTIKGSPARPEPVTGATSVCAVSNEAYSVPTVAGASAYTWSVTSSGNVATGQGTKNITIDWLLTGASQGITVFTSNACGNSTNRVLSPITVAACPRLSDNSSAMQMVVFPNPATERVTVQFNAADAGDYRLRITDMSGRVVFAEEAAAQQGFNTRDLNLGEFASGIYMLSLDFGNEQQMIRLMVE